MHFAVWAPHASRVSVVGDFNRWDGRRHPMRKRIDSGVWEIFIPEMTPEPSTSTRSSVRTGVLLPLEGRSVRLPERTAAVDRLGGGPTADFTHGATPTTCEPLRNAIPRRQPMAIYEVHLGSWRRRDDGAFLT